MPSNLLLFLPLLGGYAFIHICYLTRYRAQSLSGYALLFEVAWSGFLSVIIVRLILNWLGGMALVSAVRDFWHYQPFALPYSGTILAGTLLAPSAGIVCNLALGLWHYSESFRASLDEVEPRDNPDEHETKADHPLPSFSRFLEFSRGAALNRATSSSGNDLLNTLRKAAAEEKILFVSLSDRKIYIGWVGRAPTLKADDRYVSIVPVLSGHRDADSLKVTYDVLYNESTLKEKRELAVVLPVQEIREARIYHFDLEIEHLQAETAAPQDDQSANS